MIRDVKSRPAFPRDLRAGGEGRAAFALSASSGYDRPSFAPLLRPGGSPELLAGLVLAGSCRRTNCARRFLLSAARSEYSYSTRAGCRHARVCRAIDRVNQRSEARISESYDSGIAEPIFVDVFSSRGSDVCASTSRLRRLLRSARLFGSFLCFFVQLRSHSCCLGRTNPRDRYFESRAGIRDEDVQRFADPTRAFSSLAPSCSRRTESGLDES